MGTKHANRKGMTFQNIVSKWFRPMFASATSAGVIQSAKKGLCDVENTPFWIECKTGKRPNIKKAYLQSVEDKKKCNDDRPIIVVTHFDQEKPGQGAVDLVTVNQDLFFDLLRLAHYGRIKLNRSDYTQTTEYLGE